MVAAIAWLVKTLLSSVLSRDLERFKTELKGSQ